MAVYIVFDVETTKNQMPCYDRTSDLMAIFNDKARIQLLTYFH